MHPLSAMAQASRVLGELRSALLRPGVPAAELSDRMAERYGSRTAIAGAGGETSFEQLALDTRRAAAALSEELGVGAGDQVLLLGAGGAEALPFALGAWRLGAGLVMAGPDGESRAAPDVRAVLILDGRPAPSGATAGWIGKAPAGGLDLSLAAAQEDAEAPPARAGQDPVLRVLGGPALAEKAAHHWWTPGLTFGAPPARMLIAIGPGEPEGLAACVGALAAGATVRICAPEAIAAEADGAKAAALRPADVAGVASLLGGRGLRLLVALGPGAGAACREVFAAGGGPRALAAVETVAPRISARVWHASLGKLGRNGLPVPI